MSANKILLLVPFSYNFVAFTHYNCIFRDDVSKTTAGDGYVYESYYDDYTPEMEQEYSSSWQGGSNEYDATAQQNGPYYQQNENDGQQQYYPQQ